MKNVNPLKVWLEVFEFIEAAIAVLGLCGV